MIRLRVIAALALVSVATMAFAACGGDDDEYGGAATTAPTTAASAPAGSSANIVKINNSPKFGTYLTTADGLTLYVFNQDTPGKSNCTGSCAATWPPLTTTASAVAKPEGVPGDFTLVTRDDGSTQVAFNGKPLYRYGPDKAPGDTGGHGIGEVWFVAVATTGAVSGASPAASGTPAAGTTPAAGSDGYIQY